MALPSDFAQHVKSSADIVRIIGEHVRLKKAGNSFVGLCPFHQEKTPSFNVHPTRQFFYCFGCGAKGDVFRFVMDTEKIAFPEAVRRVAQRAGIPIPADTSASEPMSPERRLRAALEDLHQKTLEFFRRQLLSVEAAPVRELIRKRGVSEQSAEEFGLGFAPASGSALTNFLTKQGYSPEVLEACGVLARRDQGGFFDRFRNRWIFPIAAENGKIVAFGGRALGDDHPKYLNSPETPLYTKSRVLYNLSRARDAIRTAGGAVMVEGYMDAIAVYQAGIKNVVASCGTALTESQARMLARHGTEVVVSYDPDSAGVNAADRSVSLLLEEGLSVKILRLPDGLDPDQFIQQKGAEAYRSQLSDAQPFFRYLAGRALELHGKATPQAKLAGINFVLPYLAKVPNKLIRAELVKDISQKLEVSSGIILDSFRNAGLDRRESVKPPADLGFLPPDEAMLIRLFLESEEAARELGPYLEEKELLGEFELASLITALVGMISAGTVPDVASLSDRLDESQQKSLARIVFDKGARPVSYGEVSAYIRSMELERLERRRSALQRDIIEAQKLLDTQRYRELLREKLEVDRELDTLL